MNKDLKAVLIVAIAVFVIITVAIALLPEPATTTSKLPYNYEVCNLRGAMGEENLSGLKITTTLGCNDRTIPVIGEEIEISYYDMSESDSTIFIRDENGDGEWRISTSFANDRRSMKIEWVSEDIEIGENIILPTGEKVTLLGFDSDKPLFSVVE